MTPLLALRGIEKSFGTEVKALKGVDFTLSPGEVAVLLGENGAGKSTLLKAITGIQPPDAGEIQFQGETVDLSTPARARALGIRMVYQELNLAPHLSVAANISLGAEPCRRGLIDHAAVRERARAVLSAHGFALDPDARVETLGPAQRQVIEIARALAEDAKLLLLDEPTSSLGEKEIGELFQTIRQLKAKGIGIVYVSHRLPECFEIGDRIVVLRDGQKVYEAPVSQTDTSTVVRAMVGRSLADFYPRERVEPGPVRLEVALDGIAFTARAGEVVGIAGLTGAGRTELLETVFGLRRAAGTVQVDGKNLPLGKGPRAAIAAGVGLLTEDRKRTGLALGLPVRHNLTLAALSKIAPGPWLHHGRDREAAQAQVEALSIKTASTESPAGSLSGGNQQKAVLGRWLHAGSSVLLFDEPTRGVDVGSKVEIYQRMNAATRAGGIVLMASSELPELLGMSDRVLALFQGRLAADLPKARATPERVLHFCMTGEDIDDPG